MGGGGALPIIGALAGAALSFTPLAPVGWSMMGLAAAGGAAGAGLQALTASPPSPPDYSALLNGLNSRGGGYEMGGAQAGLMAQQSALLSEQRQALKDDRARFEKEQAKREAERTAQDQARRDYLSRNAKGRRSTLLTGGQGVTEDPEVITKELLGE